MHSSICTAAITGWGHQASTLRHVQEFAIMLQEAAAAAGGRLEAVNAPLADYGLPPQFTHQHLAVQYTEMVTRLLAAH
jgi:hypothetical protein